ncbi:MAG: hypothetical protein M3O70_23775 [Actinomycetota bacterium]|nr:hypothetical protein [Actinomycetota bacterium]
MQNPLRREQLEAEHREACIVVHEPLRLGISILECPHPSRKTALEASLRTIGLRLLDHHYQLSPQYSA